MDLMEFEKKLPNITFAPNHIRCAPFVKWAGGKRQLMPEILKYVPEKYGVYYEPFVGGGAVFFALTHPKGAVLGDANKLLAGTYEVVRDDVESLIRVLSHHDDSAETFAQIRDLMNSGRVKNGATLASWVIYLNRTCFNGLWRVNKSGGYNVPYDATRIGKRMICDTINLRLASAALADTVVHASDFAATVSSAKKGDFVYCDPPYVPAGGYSDFTGYAKGGFGPDEQARLVECARKLKSRGVHVLLSNADVPEVRKLYKGFTLHPVRARRAINSKASKRGHVGELLIT